ncbi:Putative HAD superfamily, haloacid dehalogenase-like hydrolase [Colletotrichum destructivum]|uniref:HAD superfamily, haloacid dehalogenase-like hydrolase n=1 Tax=Colletotrichum destructivum TaxID=34406 RepID=A0AAX4I1L5_9PEZI|nr:Putative HAD superfamily, haloacid dehalogenase-like hydrolase [Colletotrichum destructivum]
MLVRLREHGFRLGIVTNGQLKDQLEKSDAIGVHHLVDNIITSEEAGCCKPDKRLFHLAIEALGATLQNSCMIGEVLNAESNTVHDLAKELSAILAAISVENYVFAIFRTGRNVAKAASPINETAIRISFRGQDEQKDEPGTQVRFHITERLHSIRIDYEKCFLSSKSCIEARLLESLRMLQACCDNLMRDHPRAALRNLRSVMMILAEIAGIEASLVVEGEEIDL